MRCSAVLGCFEYVVKIRRKEKGYILKMRHIERQNDF